MHLTKLNISSFRNITSVNIEPCLQFNIIFGDNGQGKTSIIEAIYLLATGRSFRTNNAKKIINDNATEFSLFTLVNSHNNQFFPIGVAKDNKGKTRIRLSGKNIQRISEVAEILPVQLLNGDSIQLLHSGPKLRRKFIDWGMFHVEHSFLSVWRSYQRALKQRNSILQQHRAIEQIKPWDKAIVDAAQRLNQMRSQYIELLVPVANQLLQKFLRIPEIELSYQRGWSRDKTLETVLEEGFLKDLKLGYTQYGSHRADLSIKINKVPAQEVLSRGQQKLLVNALLLAQGIVLQQQANKQCIYLIDDLLSDLDNIALSQMLEILRDLKAQVFITSIRAEQLNRLFDDVHCLFEINKGCIYC